jgi:hypothetical protein
MKRALGIRFGVYASAGMIFWFILMKVFGLISNTYLHFVNYLIIGICIYLTIKRLKTSPQATEMTYLASFGEGFWVSFSSAIIFSVFIFIYSNLDKTFIGKIAPNLPYSNTLNPAEVAFEILSETIIISVILCMMVPFLFKSRSLSTYGGKTEINR